MKTKFLRQKIIKDDKSKNNLKTETVKIDKTLSKRLTGKLLLQVEQGGAIWYVDQNGYRHGVTWNNLMDLFKKLSLGITNADLEKIASGSL